MRTRSYRRHKLSSKWIRRTKYWMINESYIWDNDGHKINHPTIVDCLKSHQSKIYKSTGSPCSCFLCAWNKYDRNQLKKKYRI